MNTDFFPNSENTLLNKRMFLINQLMYLSTSELEELLNIHNDMNVNIDEDIQYSPNENYKKYQGESNFLFGFGNKKPPKPTKQEQRAAVEKRIERKNELRGIAIDAIFHDNFDNLVTVANTIANDIPNPYDELSYLRSLAIGKKNDIDSWKDMYDYITKLMENAQ